MPIITITASTGGVNSGYLPRAGFGEGVPSGITGYPNAKTLEIPGEVSPALVRPVASACAASARLRWVYVTITPSRICVGCTLDSGAVKNVASHPNALATTIRLFPSAIASKSGTTWTRRRVPGNFFISPNCISAGGTTSGSSGDVNRIKEPKRRGCINFCNARLSVRNCSVRSFATAAQRSPWQSLSSPHQFLFHGLL